MGELKIVLIGDSGVGKTCILTRFKNNVFHTTEIPTIGANFITHDFTVEGEKKQVAIWDTASQEKYQSLVSMYYRNTNGCVIVFALDNRNSFQNVKIWYDNMVDIVGKDIAIMLVGNKNDLDDQVVKEHEIKELAEDLCCDWCTVSAKSGEGIKECFDTLCPKLKYSNTNDDFENVNANNSHLSCC